MIRRSRKLAFGSDTSLGGGNQRESRSESLAIITWPGNFAPHSKSTTYPNTKEQMIAIPPQILARMK